MFDKNGFKCELTVSHDDGDSEIEFVNHIKNHFLLIFFEKKTVMKEMRTRPKNMFSIS
jgi:hypothetical protein